MTKHYNTWCEKCRNYTLHEVKDEKDKGTIKCPECGKTFEITISGRRERVVKSIHEGADEPRNN